MITAATLTYSDGTSADFTGEPLDLTILPLQSPDELAKQEATDTAPEEVPEVVVEAPAEESEVAPEIAPEVVHVSPGETIEVVGDKE